MVEDDLSLWRRSADAWVEIQGRHGDAARRFLDPYVLNSLGPVKGRKVLDIGCGEGRFGRKLQAAGARVVGLEPTPPLSELTSFPTVVGLAEQLPFGAATFDLALFYLVLIDVECYEAAILEATRVLKHGGRLLSVNLTPMATSANEPFWERNETGEKVARRIEFYGMPQGVVYEWSGLRIRNYHRPLRDYMRTYLGAGLQLEQYDEPMDSAAMPDSIISPNFDLMVWRKS